MIIIWTGIIITLSYFNVIYEILMLNKVQVAEEKNMKVQIYFITANVVN